MTREEVPQQIAVHKQKFFDWIYSPQTAGVKPERPTTKPGLIITNLWARAAHYLGTRIIHKEGEWIYGLRNQNAIQGQSNSEQS